MMLTIRTEYTTSPSGVGQIRASGHGRQRTVKYAHSQSVTQNHAKALGTLVNLMTNDEQQATLRDDDSLVMVTEHETYRDWYLDI